MRRIRLAKPHLPNAWIDRGVDFFVAVFSMMAALVLTSETAALREERTMTPVLTVAAIHGASVVFRRLRPWPVLVVLVVTAVAYALMGYPAFMLGPAVLFAVHSAGAVLERRSSLVALGGVEIAAAAVLVLGPGYPGLPAVAMYLAIVAVAWWLGHLVRRWRIAAEAHARRADELAATRDELARYAVTAERRRIARELHDAVAHSMTVVAMHAGTGRLVGADDPASALSSLAMIERLSREAVGEMRRLVGLLRDEADDESGLAPAPGIGDLHALVAEMVDAGVAVEVHIEGPLEAVPAGPALAGFRIIQEALTNAVKHSGMSKAVIRVEVLDTELSIEIKNDAPNGGTVRLAQSTGLGMIGMRERVQVYDGSLTAGPAPGGGFRVAARIPVSLMEQ